MSDLLEWVRALYPVAASLISLVAAIAVVWLSSRFVSWPKFSALNADMERLRLQVTEHGRQIRHLEEHAKESPTRVELQDDIAQLSARMAGVEVGMRGVSNQLSTTNSYLHTLIEKGLQR